MDAERNRRPLLSAGLLIGIGMGGFVDGIVFHQILQVHSMLSAQIPKTSIANIEINMFWDGVFHAFCWLLTITGIFLLWSAGKRPEVPWSGRTLLGSLILGWGVFNLIEGIIDHHILNLHHVIERLGVSFADYTFLLSGIVFALIGWSLIREDSKDTNPGPVR